MMISNRKLIISKLHDPLDVTSHKFIETSNIIMKNVILLLTV